MIPRNKESLRHSYSDFLALSRTKGVGLSSYISKPRIERIVSNKERGQFNNPTLHYKLSFFLTVQQELLI